MRALATWLGRSFFPFLALVTIGGAVLWGPWVSLLLVYGAWRTVARIA